MRFFATISLLVCIGTAFAQDKKSVVIGTLVDRPNALLVINPPGANQGFLLPQLSTAQRLSINPASPNDDGLMVFDLTDKSFYHWNNSAWVKGLGEAGGGSASQTLSYDPATQRLTISGTNNVDLSTLKEVPVQTGQAGKYLTTNGTTLSWATLSSLGDITGITTAAGSGLVGGTTSGDVILSVNTDGTTVSVNGANQVQVADGGVSTTKLGNNSVTSAKIADGAVTSADILDATIVSADLAANAVSTGNIIDGTITSADLSSNAVSSANIVDGTIISADLSLNAVSSSNIVDGTITSADLSLNAVSSTNIVDGSITSADLFDGAVTSADILDGTVANVDMAANAISTTNILDGTITSADLSLNAVSSTNIVDGSITSADLFDGAVTSADILDGTVANVDMAANAISSTNIIDGTITSADLSLNAVSSTNIVDGSISNADIANNAITSNHIQDGTVVTSDLASGGASTVLTTNSSGVVSWVPQSAFGGSQTLTLAGDELSISAGNTVNLAASGDVTGPINALTINPGATNQVMVTDVGGTDAQWITPGGDVTGSPANSTVSRIRNNPVASAAPAVGDALVWNGTAWTPTNVASGSPTTQYFAVDPSNFQGMQEDGNKDASLGLMEGNDGRYVFAFEDARSIMAPINLPHGAQIQSITVYYEITSILGVLSPINVRFLQKPLLGGATIDLTNVVIAPLISIGITPQSQSFSHTVDNSSNSYRLLVKFSNFIDADELSESTQRIYGVRIQYLK